MTKLEALALGLALVAPTVSNAQEVALAQIAAPTGQPCAYMHDGFPTMTGVACVDYDGLADRLLNIEGIGRVPTPGVLTHASASREVTYAIRILYKPETVFDRNYNLLLALSYDGQRLTYARHSVERGLAAHVVYPASGSQRASAVFLIDTQALTPSSSVSLQVTFRSDSQYRSGFSDAELASGTLAFGYQQKADVHGFIKAFPKDAELDWYTQQANRSTVGSFVDLKMKELVRELFGGGLGAVSKYVQVFHQGQTVNLPPLFVDGARPRIRISGTSLDFGATIGSVQRQDLTVYNDGQGDLVIESVRVEAPFSLAKTLHGRTAIKPHGALTIPLLYRPSSRGTSESVLVLQHNDLAAGNRTELFLRGVVEVTTATISGRVTQPTGLVVTGARVTAVERSSGRKYRAETDQLGAYRFRDLPAGTYSLRAERNGFVPSSMADVTAAPGDDVTFRISLDTFVKSELDQSHGPGLSEILGAVLLGVAEGIASKGTPLPPPVAVQNAQCGNVVNLVAVLSNGQRIPGRIAVSPAVGNYFMTASPGTITAWLGAVPAYGPADQLPPGPRGLPRLEWEDYVRQFLRWAEAVDAQIPQGVQASHIELRDGCGRLAATVR